MKNTNPNSVPTMADQYGFTLEPTPVTLPFAFDSIRSQMPSIIEQLQRTSSTNDFATARHLLLNSMRSLGFALEDLLTGAEQLREAGKLNTVVSTLTGMLNEREPS